MIILGTHNNDVTFLNTCYIMFICTVYICGFIIMSEQPRFVI